MQSLIQAFSEDTDFQSIVQGIRSSMKEQLISGLTGSSRPLMVASLQVELQRPLVVVTHNMFSAQKMAEDLLECLPEDQVLLYPANELLITENAIASPEMLAQRVDALSKLAAGFSGVCVVPYAGVRKLLPNAEQFRKSKIDIKVGDTVDLNHLLTQMAELGYNRVDRVESKGEMSVRGGILDFYPLISDYAYRVELFDVEVDSIRTFDPNDQRSLDKHLQVLITPCREIIASKKRLSNAAEHASQLLQEQLAKMTDRHAKQKLEEEIRHDLELLREGHYFQGIYKYISLLFPEQSTLMNYISKDAVLLIDEPNRLIEASKELDKDEAEWITGLLAEGKSLPAFTLSKGYESLLHRTAHPTLYISLFLRQVPQTQPQNIVNFMCRGMQSFHGQMNLLKTELERWKKTNNRVILLAAGEERMDRLKRVLQDFHIDLPEIANGSLQSGFELPSIRLVVVTEGELFNQKQRKARKTEKRIENAERIRSYMELKVGDYVVHINHGIGKYVGIGTLVINGIHKDYMHVLYAGGDKLSVPIDQIELIQRYVGSEDKEPKIHKLGGADWARTKSKARGSVQDIAGELIQLYALRQATKGNAFHEDTSYQQEFESLFPYEETPDQLRAIEEIKKDMELVRPMDRLLCGDVGYGKTEVAIRAAFKAVMDGKQVAVLVPTTILAQQHYETFRERFSGYPIQIQVLSRFRSKKEQTESIKGARTGTVDVIIGTHRLLSSDVQFKDLGLLVVDEEQRFGVSHKEKLKRLKTNVDVLTLTATPIPRTLHMSMLGVRDLSVIETPPENRFPVQTYVVEHSRALVREAIERELARGGQVYCVFNRIQGINQLAEQISDLVPDARVAVGHGQMSEGELERTILGFLEGEFDVLVSTSIIETGVDIPNVNTMIVYDADKMGLSQLYQLRGRVGRSNRVAYAYFTYQRDKVLTEIAEKRLQAIKEFTELGSGFKIAMRDLSIRGAGNLLGAEQHGFIASVGFELYSQMLSEEIAKQRAEVDGTPVKQASAWVTQLELTLDAYLPSDYIYDSIQKIEIYKKVARIETLAEETDLHDELVDRFGNLPQAVSNLLAVARLKVYGKMFGFESIIQKNDHVQICIHKDQYTRMNGQKLHQLSFQFDGRLKLESGPPIMIIMKTKGLQPEVMVELVERFLVQYKEVVVEEGVRVNVAK